MEPVGTAFNGSAPGSFSQVAGLLGDARVGLAAYGVEALAGLIGCLGIGGALCEARVEHLARSLDRRLTHVLRAAQVHRHVPGLGGQLDGLEIQSGLYAGIRCQDQR